MANLIQNYIIVITVAVLAKYASAQMGPVDLALQSVGTCPGTDKNILDMELQSLSETEMGLNMRFNFPFAMDSTVAYKINVDKIEDGQVKQDVFVIAGANLCDDLGRYIGFMWDKFSEAMAMPTGCPKPQGDYKLENFPIDMKDIKLEEFLYGRFKMFMKIMRTGQEVACLYIEFTNSPAGESVK